MKIKPGQYIFPPRSSDAVPRSETLVYGELGWVAQLKFNDSRALVKFTHDGGVELWNRHGERFRSYSPPEGLLEQLRLVGESLGHLSGCVTILDGGLLDQKHAGIKDTVVVWDVLVLNDEHLVGSTYVERYGLLRPMGPVWDWCGVGFGLSFSGDVFVPVNYKVGDWDRLWDEVGVVNAPFTVGCPGDRNYKISPLLEGLVFKDPSGVLGFGYKVDNNREWMARSRVCTGRHAF